MKISLTANCNKRNFHKYCDFSRYSHSSVSKGPPLSDRLILNTTERIVGQLVFRFEYSSQSARLSGIMLRKKQTENKMKKLRSF